MSLPGRGRHHRPRRRGITALLAAAVALTWRADRGGFISAAGLQVLGALSPTALVLIGQYLLNNLTGERPTLVEALPPVIALALVSSVTAAAGAFQGQQQRLLSERVAGDVWERVLDVSVRVPLERYETPAFYDQLQRIRSNALSRPVNVTTSLFGLLGSTVGLVGLLVVVAAIAPLLVPMMIVATVPSLLLARRVSRIEFDFLRRGTPVFRARQYLRDVLSTRDPAKEVRVFGAEAALRQRHAVRRAEYEDLLARHTRRRVALAGIGVLISSLLLGGTLVYIVLLLVDGDLALGSAAAAILAVRFLSTALQQLLESVGGLFESSAYLADLDEFVSTEVTTASPAVAASQLLAPLRSTIDVSGVSFRYPDSARDALTDVDLVIGADEVVALVGENGSGKTTLAKLIAGLYQPVEGQITWDGLDYADLPSAALHRRIAVIFQDFVRYQLSARDNIGLGQPDDAENDQAARAAADRAGALAFLDQLPAGLDTLLTREYEGGLELSGGQWQRVALARALRKEASIVVLDEPSAALDPRSEAALFADIKATLRGRAGLLITHRFSSVRLADRIYVLSEGRIAEHGSHDELMSVDGLYRELFTLQAAAYHAPERLIARPSPRPANEQP